MKMDTELSRLVWQLVDDTGRGLLTTASKDGWPHATWMNFQMKGYLDEIFTVTAPTTQKIRNLRENSHAEWMFSNDSLESIAYLSGKTKIIEGDGVQPYWDTIPGKSRAYYRRYSNTDDFRQFVVISTEVTKVTFCRPVAYRKISVAEMRGGPGDG